MHLLVPALTYTYRQSLKAGWAEPLPGRLDWQLVGWINLFKDLANGVKQ